jgi:hypothetical protein
LLLGWLRGHPRGSWWECSIPTTRFGFSRGIYPVGKIYVRRLLNTACFAFAVGSATGPAAVRLLLLLPPPPPPPPLLLLPLLLSLTPLSPLLLPLLLSMLPLPPLLLPLLQFPLLMLQLLLLLQQLLSLLLLLLLTAAVVVAAVAAVVVSLGYSAHGFVRVLLY